MLQCFRQQLTDIAQADPDTDFANQLHTYGIYRQKDYNAWIGKITCTRMDNNVDHDAYQSAKFVFAQLHEDSTTKQAWQFLGAAIQLLLPRRNEWLLIRPWEVTNMRGRAIKLAITAMLLAGTLAAVPGVA